MVKNSFIDNEYDDEEEDTLQDMYLIFCCADRHYSVEVRYVSEIVALQTVTEIPDMPSYFKGVINLRGKILPVLDMRLRLGYSEMQYHERTCCIVSDKFGMIVDSVTEVARIPASEITGAPNIGEGVSHQYVSGVSRSAEELRIILNIKSLLDPSEGQDELMSALNKTVQ
ncbi:MAG TPA: chemotaxis protein CheW [Leptospiraceae bacterium]|nr:chemotaxis protein CheW [Leptospiraceae bacterium]HNF12173.1 chemotaxis protein CheW [Leptospiraceae bacterium]HNH10854.1 chemotaxis protein CheW [Leptospiraceae bacterium]HNI97025.1 chemotaxis protein CheW [Leptospiraceae bacterium]HNN06385.1 chemotaxis protein CheW [Leptospiraceae bacterium]